MFDVDPIVGGDTVGGYTILTNLYQRYRIHAVKVTIYIANDAACPTSVCLYPQWDSDPGTTFSGGFNQVSNYPYAIRKMISAQGGADRAKLTKFYNLKKMWGDKSLEADVTVQSSAVGANPTHELYFALAIQNHVGGVNVTLPYMITVDLYTEWYERVYSATAV